MTITEKIHDRVKLLPEPLAREVLDFAESVRSREYRSEWNDLMGAQSVSLKAIWDKDADRAWDTV